jgi:hypothetical protein
MGLGREIQTSKGKVIRIKKEILGINQEISFGK